MIADSKKLVPALVKTELVLNYIAEHKQVSFTQIHKDLGLAKSSVHSLLGTLEHFQYIRQTSSGEYSLGLKLFQLGGLAVANINLKTEAKPFVSALANEVQLTTHLGILQGTEGIYLIKKEIEHILRITSWEGKSIHLLSSALGKALMAWQPQALLDEIFERHEMLPYTEKTIKSIPAMIDALAEVREKGWAIDDEEDGYGVRCVASAVRGADNEIIAAVSVCGTLHQMPQERMADLGDKVIECCRNISQKMGYQE